MAERKDPPKPGEVETTGHSWDGIEEYNNPLPRWWLWIFYATIVWGLLYSLAYPAWPMLTQATQGFLGYNQREAVAQEIERFHALNAPMRDRLVAAELDGIPNDAELLRFANQAGAAVYKTWCATCHGAGAAGVQAAGYPNLLDDDWLWGGTVEEIHYTVSHGIRNTTDPDAHWSQMPAFADMLDRDEIAALVNYTLMISGQEHDLADVAAAEELYLDNCASCHGDDGRGNRDMGAPNLTDAIWLYGGDAASIEHSIRYSRFGVMPGWTDRLSEADIRAVAVYVHGLGGGE